MGAKYYATNLATNTASTTVPMWALAGSTSRRLRLYHLMIGCPAAPANQAADFQCLRQSARGTSNASFTANPLDPADTEAATGLYDTGWAVNPTITSVSNVGGIPMNQQATAQWMVDPTNGIVVPATSGAGLAFLSVSTTAAASYRFETWWEE